jgi:hypothetical protein
LRAFFQLPLQLHNLLLRRLQLLLQLRNRGCGRS